MSDDLKINLPTNLSVTEKVPHQQPTSEGDNRVQFPEVMVDKGEGQSSLGAQNSLASGRNAGDVRWQAESMSQDLCNPYRAETQAAPSQNSACPQSVASPSLAAGEPKQPSLRPSPISGVTPPIETRWRKGQSGNPGGRPKITREETAKWLEEKQEDGKTNARKAIESVGEVAQSAGRHSAAALKTLHDILPDDKKDESKGGGINIGSLNMAIIQQITEAATESSLE